MTTSTATSTSPPPGAAAPPVPADGAMPGPLARVLGATPPPALLLVSIISIQLGAAVAINLFDTLGPVAMTFLRLAIAASILLVVARRSLGAAVRSDLGLLLLFGVVIGAMNLMFYGALSRIPLGIAVAIEFIGPLGVAAATSRQPRHFAFIGLAAVGLLLLTPDIGTDLDPLGVVLALGAGAGWAGFVLLSPRVGAAVGNVGLAVGMGVAALVTVPAVAATGGIRGLEPGVLVGALAVAILSTALPLSLEFEALRRMTARAYGIIVTLEPVAAGAIGAVVLSQALPPNALAAIACVTVAAIGVTLTDRGSDAGSATVAT